MKFSEHYLIHRLAMRGISLEQAVFVVDNPAHIELQDNGRTRYWSQVAGFSHYVRVVVEPDGETILTTFVDSRFQLPQR